MHATVIIYSIKYSKNNTQSYATALTFLTSFLWLCSLILEDLVPFRGSDGKAEEGFAGGR